MIIVIINSVRFEVFTAVTMKYAVTEYGTPNNNGLFQTFRQTHPDVYIFVVL
jgi:hypothetical protein